MKERRLNEVRGVILVAVGLMVLASLIRFERLDLSFYTSHPNIPLKNLLGIFGAYLGGIIVFLFGRPTSFLIPLFILMLGIKFFRQQIPYLSIARILGILILLLSIGSLIGMFNLKNEFIRFYYAGFLGAVISNFITAYFSRLGGFIIFVTFIILSLALVTEILISSLFLNVINKTNSILKPIFSFRMKSKAAVIKPVFTERKESKESLVSKALPKVESISKPTLSLKPKIQIKTKPLTEEAKIRPQEIKIGDYHLPTLDLLESPPPLEARQIKEDLTANARILEDTLDDFGISVKVTDIERGPIITRYELEPAPGVKLNRIVALSDDIALTMKAQSVRIVAPIPGKGRVGVEVPNIQSSFVYLKEVIASSEFQKSESKLTLALGKDIAGQPVMADLSDMPHLLIAGTTGSGKTVCMNCLILSMLFKATPNELKLLMIDPKMVELAPFNGLAHLLCPVVTDAK
ncbi:MAG: DNA translocase FtsK 4TM domain-containing protein [Candidatus Omnitrophota bacterium]|nr:DNA translocase FtsK 4TM domain-containing protein [Candidatus Omnitrophota bacterium]